MKKGFTLIELLITVAIICLLATISILAYKNATQHQCVKSHAERVLVEQHIEQQGAWIGGHYSIVPILVPEATTTQVICDEYKK